MASQTLRSAGETRPLKFSLKPSKQTCYALAGLLGAGLIGGAGLYVWQSGELNELQKQVTARQEKVASGQKIASRLVASEAAYADVQRQIRYLETSVTASEYVPTLLRQMEGLAKSVSLQVGAVRPKLEPAPLPPSDAEARKKFVPWPYDKIHIDMEVRGTYWNVAKLLYRLTEFPKIMAVESVQVQPNTTAQTGKTPQLTANVRLTGFIFPNDGTGAGTPAGTQDAVISANGAVSASSGNAGTAPAPARPPAAREAL